MILGYNILMNHLPSRLILDNRSFIFDLSNTNPEYFVKLDIGFEKTTFGAASKHMSVAVDGYTGNLGESLPRQQTYQLGASATWLALANSNLAPAHHFTVARACISVLSDMEKELERSKDPQKLLKFFTNQGARAHCEMVRTISNLDRFYGKTQSWSPNSNIDYGFGVTSYALQKAYEGILDNTKKQAIDLEVETILGTTDLNDLPSSFRP